MVLVNLRSINKLLQLFRQECINTYRIIYHILVRQEEKGMVVKQHRKADMEQVVVLEKGIQERPHLKGKLLEVEGAVSEV